MKSALNFIVYIEKLHIINFKNFEEAKMDFSQKANVLVGLNGSGKTNLLDAIYYLAFTKSAFNASDLNTVREGETASFIKGTFQNSEKSREITCGLQRGSKKSFREEGQEYGKLSDHIGKYPVVLMEPDDTELIKGGGEVRRKFIDGILSQIDPIYLTNLIAYNHILKQRNSLIRMFNEGKAFDATALETYDHQLVSNGETLFKNRQHFITEFVPIFRKYYDFLVEEKEIADIHYTSGLQGDNFRDGLLTSRRKDLALGRTTFGVHRDDFVFLLNDVEIKKRGSQGQQKSFVIALRLAQREVISNHKGFSPILLMDDIFDKLDDFRIERLLELIHQGLGQFFITDARPDRTQGLLDRINVSASVFVVENGKVSGR